MHANAHFSTVYNSQDMEATQMSINREMDKDVVHIYQGIGSDGKEIACNAGDPGSIPGSGRSPGEWNGYPLQYSCLKNSTDRPRGCKESRRN